jgi:hypothetical protein
LGGTKADATKKCLGYVVDVIITELSPPKEKSMFFTTSRV